MVSGVRCACLLRAVCCGLRPLDQDHADQPGIDRDAPAEFPYRNFKGSGLKF